MIFMSILYIDLLKVLIPYISIDIKHIKGKTKDAFTAGIPSILPISIIDPCNGGINAPPTIAITNPAAPSVESSFNP